MRDSSRLLSLTSILLLLLADSVRVSRALFFSPGPKHQEPLSAHALDCPAGLPSATAPRSVHRLRPGDVRVVAALGDSVTAGNGAYSRQIADVLTEYRGVSWSIGGRGHFSSVFTLPNALQQFSPHLLGASTGSGGANSTHAGLNVAVTGSLHQDMPRQARELVRRLRLMLGSRLPHEWKLVTLMTGGNNLCSKVCRRDARRRSSGMFEHSPYAHALYIRRALDILRQHLPRTFVNLVPVVDVTALMDIRRKNLPCRLAESHLCPCLFGKRRWKRRHMRGWVSRYQQALQRLVESGRYDSTADFTVVFQPFNLRSHLPMKRSHTSQFPAAVLEADQTYMSADCFHLSQRGHALMARALWNNMLEPLGEKSWSWQSMDDRLMCPSEQRPFFTTALNPTGSLWHTDWAA